jgi:hypothetical protein
MMVCLLVYQLEIIKIVVKIECVNVHMTWVDCYRIKVPMSCQSCQLKV